MPRPWHPSPLIKLTFALHAGAGLALAAAPGLWPQTLAALAANHAALTAAGLWPRSRWLGPNLTHLPASATARGEVALTIDDGPDPEVTPRVLDLLDQADARASFFCIGEQARRHPGLAREIFARGHTVENHSQRHLKTFSALGPGGMRREVADGQATLADITGVPPRFFRPTAGLRNPFLEPVLARLDLQLATWSRRAFDTRYGDPDRALQRLGQHLTAGEILLLHDGNAARTPNGQPLILEVLPALLAHMAASGLRPVSLASALESDPS